MTDRKLSDLTTKALPAEQLRGAVGRTLILPSFRAVCVRGADRGREWLIDLPVARVGRADDAEVALTDSSTSRIHAILRLTSRGWTIQDNGSRNGVLVDGVRVNEAFVGDGSTIALGGTSLVFHPSEARVRTAPATAEWFHGLMGPSAQMRELVGVLQKVGPLPVTVMLSGPTGAGKGAVARALHRASPRAERPFAVLDCGNLDPGMMRSELFGHEKSAPRVHASKRLELAVP